jgi:hypothetical protein
VHKAISRHVRSVVADLAVGEDGKISIITIIVVVIFFLLIGFVVNGGQGVVEKIEVQIAADSVAYSSAVWMARGMNAVTTTNHLMGELTSLLVVLESFGGPTLGGDQNDDDESAEGGNGQDNSGGGSGQQSSSGGCDGVKTNESKEMNGFISDFRRPATYAGTLAFLQTIDDELLEQVEEWLTDDDGCHKAGATIYDTKMSIKYCAVTAIGTKAVCETVRKCDPGKDCSGMGRD